MKSPLLFGDSFYRSSGTEDIATIRLGKIQNVVIIECATAQSRVLMVVSNDDIAFSIMMPMN